MNKATGECALSKPLPKALQAGSDVPLATLKYLPLYPWGRRSTTRRPRAGCGTRSW